MLEVHAVVATHSDFSGVEGEELPFGLIYLQRRSLFCLFGSGRDASGVGLFGGMWFRDYAIC